MRSSSTRPALRAGGSKSAWRPPTRRSLPPSFLLRSSFAVGPLSSWLWHESFVLGYAIHKDGRVVNAVELVGDGSIDGNLDGAGWQFRDHDADGSGSEAIGTVGLLHIERAAGVIIGLAAGIDLDGALGRWGNRRASGR